MSSTRGRKGGRSRVWDSSYYGQGKSAADWMTPFIRAHFPDGYCRRKMRFDILLYKYEIIGAMSLPEPPIRYPEARLVHPRFGLSGHARLRGRSIIDQAWEWPSFIEEFCSSWTPSLAHWIPGAGGAQHELPPTFPMATQRGKSLPLRYLPGPTGPTAPFILVQGCVGFIHGYSVQWNSLDVLFISFDGRVANILAGL